MRGLFAMQTSCVALLLLFVGSAHSLIEGLYCGTKNCYEGESHVPEFRIPEQSNITCLFVLFPAVLDVDRSADAVRDFFIMIACMRMRITTNTALHTYYLWSTLAYLYNPWPLP